VSASKQYIYRDTIDTVIIYVFMNYRPQNEPAGNNSRGTAAATVGPAIPALSKPLAGTVGTTTPPQETVSSPVVELPIASTTVFTKLCYTGPITIFYGSETGTADLMSRKLTKEGKNAGPFMACLCGICLDATYFCLYCSGFEVNRVDLADYTPEMLQTCGIGVFLMANRGEGEPSSSAQAFFDYIENKSKKLGPTTLKSLNYCVFGLGNSTYVNTFNRMGKATNAYLELLGATRIFPYGQGDDSQDLESDFNAWKAALWADFLPKYLPNKAASKQETKPADEKPKRPFMAVVKAGLTSVTPQFIDSKMTPEQHHNLLSGFKNMDKLSQANKQYFHAVPLVVQVNRELRNNGNRVAAGLRSSKSELDDKILTNVGSTRHLELDIAGSCMFRYETAADLGILPLNGRRQVTIVAQALGYEVDQVFDLVSTAATNDNNKYDFKPPFPFPCTIGEALTHYFDIAGALDKDALSELGQFTTCSYQREWLRKVTASDSEYQTLVKSGNASLLALMQSPDLLNTCKIPFEEFIFVIPHLKPRYYTISSSNLAYPQSIHLSVSVLAQMTSGDKLFRGLCSSYLASMTNVGVDSVRVFVDNPTPFKLPEDPSIPIVMVGPGTGIAPMRALLQERAAQRTLNNTAAGTKNMNNAENKRLFGSNTLYFGSRRRSLDYLYENELLSFVEAGVLNRLHLAFSREEGEKKAYVQDLIVEEENAGAFVRDIVDLGGYLYICGATKMGHDVVAAFEQLLVSKKGMSAAEAKAFVAKLFSAGRIVQELWSSA
jgi:NADPH-ferrihemoprotein reductase